MDESLEKKRVVLGITGSIAAYKSAEVARLLVSRGFTVRVVMTPAATEFVSPLTMASVTGNPVVTDFWGEGKHGEIGHIELADWADVVAVVPASADTIAKTVAGFADTPLLAVLLATKAPIIMAPAMNVNMYEHPRTQENITVLRNRGVQFVDPEEGALACGWNGAGRLADPWQIFYNILRILSEGDYTGRRVLITTGPTREPLDPVRFISNRSSGKMGLALAREAFRRGAEVTLVHGPVSLKVPSAVKSVPVVTAQEMRDKVFELALAKNDRPDVVIMAAAVADYRPSNISDTKIKKNEKALKLELVKNPDILSELGAKRGDDERPILVGFAVETGDLDELLEEATSKLKAKNADMIVGNFAEDAFDLDTNRVWMVDKNGKREEVSTTFKSRIATKILNKILKL